MAHAMEKPRNLLLLLSSVSVERFIRERAWQHSIMVHRKPVPPYYKTTSSYGSIHLRSMLSMRYRTVMINDCEKGKPGKHEARLPLSPVVQIWKMQGYSKQQEKSVFLWHGDTHIHVQTNKQTHACVLAFQQREPRLRRTAKFESHISNIYFIS